MGGGVHDMQTQINGTSVRSAMETWWNGRGDPSKQVKLFDSCNDISCNPTCAAEMVAGARDYSASLSVWIIALITIAASLASFGSGEDCTPGGSGGGIGDGRVVC